MPHAAGPGKRERAAGNRCYSPGLPQNRQRRDDKEGPGAAHDDDPGGGVPRAGGCRHQGGLEVVVRAAGDARPGFRGSRTDALPVAFLPTAGQPNPHGVGLRHHFGQRFEVPGELSIAEQLQVRRTVLDPGDLAPLAVCQERDRASAARAGDARLENRARAAQGRRPRVAAAQRSAEAEHAEGVDRGAVHDDADEGARCHGSSGRVARGIEELREAYRITFANKPIIKVDIGKIIPAGEDLALIIGSWRSTAETSAGETKVWSGTYTDIVRRQSDGTWKLVLDNPNGLEGPK